MSSTVDVYLAYPGDMPSLAQNVAVLLGTTGYFGTKHGYTYTISSLTELGETGFATLRLSVSDWSELDLDTTTAFEPYGYELSIEVGNVHHLSRKNVQRKLGFRFFESLTKLERPLALGDEDDILADFHPVRGVREFPPGTSWDEDGRETWFDLNLFDTTAKTSTALQRTSPAHGAVTVFEQNGLVQVLPRINLSDDTRETITAPVASLRSTAGDALLGRTLAEVFNHSALADAATTANPWKWITGTSRMSLEDYVRVAVSVDLTLTHETISAFLHAPSIDLLKGHRGPPFDFLTTSRKGAWDDESMGGFLLTQIGKVRTHLEER
ncbi:hypothetical protein [Actinomadura rifamycini]|uniref:hypothetical protein n=1 Tax=Actinomadura rifamycini TaxID=31962 RepID=UPI0012FA419D|nr:hypothetical protein [Actinomadura rifamycini]